MTRRAISVLVWLGLLVVSVRGQARAQDVLPDATLFRVFLTDGSTLVSFGEVTRVADRVIFSMPTTESMVAPALQLVNISAGQVDWGRTNSYAEAARASHYIATRAAADYAALSNDVAQTLNTIAQTADRGERLAIVQAARRKLAEWPASHYNYNQTEVQQLLAFLDEAIADLRAAGGGRFDLNLVATGGTKTPSYELLMPRPTLKESIELLLVAARHSETAVERSALLSMALDRLVAEAPKLPPDWVAATTTSARAALEGEVATDRAYAVLSETMKSEAAKRAANADVRGIERLLKQIDTQDQALGARRPDVVIALVENVAAQLANAQKLKLVRDHWEIRLPAFRAYRTSIGETLDLFARLKPALEDIQALAGSTLGTLVTMKQVARRIGQAVATITPPEELSQAHALLMSAAFLAESAAEIRREAAESSNMTRAWDASSAAAGALLLSSRARNEIQTLLRVPRLPQ